MKLKLALVITTALTAPTMACANPILAFLAGVGGLGGSGAAAFLGFVGYGGLTTTALSIGAFLGTTTLGNLLLSAGLSAISKGNGRSNAPDVQESRVNTRFETAPRWQLGGSAMAGGHSGIFGEYDAAGNFWYIVAHGDAEIVSAPTYFLDNVQVTLDGAGQVLTDAFCLNQNSDQYDGTGTRVPIWTIYTVSPTSALISGAKPAAFTAAFPALPVDFFLAGTCYTIIRGKALPLQHYSKAYRWQGAFSLGEPAVNVYANFTRMYDPRNLAHDINNSTTWTAGNGNPVIMWAWWRTNPFGRGRDMSEINWPKIAEKANVCDQTVLDRSGAPIPRYRCGVAFPDNRPRHECSDEILRTCDGFVAYDAAGLAYVEVGEYIAPTLEFSGARDILSAQTNVVNDGESAIDGVIVNYISPEHNYSLQPSAPWINSLYYDGTSAPNFQTIDIQGCQNHNQAFRLARAIGIRSAPSKLAGLQTTIKGILAKGVRTVSLDYDSEFAGDFEIISPVEEDAAGMSCQFSVVPIAADRYDLPFGLEGQPPQVPPALDIDNTLGAATGVVITAASVTTSSGKAVRLQATFTAPARIDRAFRFRFSPTGTSVYEYFTTDMPSLLAYSAIVADGSAYDVSWQTVTAAGRATDWSAITTIIATANPTAPPALVASGATGGVGAATVTFTTENSVNQASVAIYKNTVATFGTATLAATVVAAANVAGSQSVTLAVGTHYIWNRPQNGSGVQGPTSGPHTVVIT